MPEHLVISTICRDIVKKANQRGALTYKPCEDPSQHGILVFHSKCCARIEGNRPTITFHLCYDDDPTFKPLPPAYRSPPDSSKKAKEAKLKPEDLWVCKACKASRVAKQCPDSEKELRFVDLAKCKPGAEILNDLRITGRLYCVSRGKELLFAIDCYLFRVCFSLEGHALWIPTSMYHEIVSGDMVKRGEKSSAFAIPPHLSNGPPGVDLKVSIQAAFVRPDWTLIFVDHNVMITFHVMALRQACTPEDLEPTSELWPSLWSARHGPDFVLEQELALSTLAQWRQSSIKKEDTTPIFLAVKENQLVFNGFGAQETCDMLFLAMIHPCMPVWDVCSSEEVWERLEGQLKSFHASRLKHIPDLPSCSSERPFRMNHSAHNQFLALVLCYRRDVVQVNQSLLDSLHSHNLLDSAAVIQPSGHAVKDSSIAPFAGIKLAPTKVRTKFVKLPNYQVVFPRGKMSNSKISVYTPILARPGPHWWNVLVTFSAVEQDVKEELNKTTLGPYSFQLFVQASWTMAKIGKSTTGKVPRGRRPLVTTSNGRLKRPLAADIHKTVQEPKRKKVKNLLEEDEEDKDKENEASVNVGNRGSRIMRNGKKVIL